MTREIASNRLTELREAQKGIRMTTEGIQSVRENIMKAVEVIDQITSRATPRLTSSEAPSVSQKLVKQTLANSSQALGAMISLQVKAGVPALLSDGITFDSLPNSLNAGTRGGLGNVLMGGQKTKQGTSQGFSGGPFNRGERWRLTSNDAPAFSALSMRNAMTNPNQALGAIGSLQPQTVLSLILLRFPSVR